VKGRKSKRKFHQTLVSLSSPNHSKVKEDTSSQYIEHSSSGQDFYRIVNAFPTEFAQSSSNPLSASLKTSYKAHKTLWMIREYFKYSPDEASLTPILIEPQTRTLLPPSLLLFDLPLSSTSLQNFSASSSRCVQLKMKRSDIERS